MKKLFLVVALWAVVVPLRAHSLNNLPLHFGGLCAIQGSHLISGHERVVTGVLVGQVVIAQATEIDLIDIQTIICFNQDASAHDITNLLEFGPEFHPQYVGVGQANAGVTQVLDLLYNSQFDIAYLKLRRAPFKSDFNYEPMDVRAISRQRKDGNAIIAQPGFIDFPDLSEHANNRAEAAILKQPIAHLNLGYSSNSSEARSQIKPVRHSVLLGLKNLPDVRPVLSEPGTLIFLWPTGKIIGFSSWLLEGPHETPLSDYIGLISPTLNLSWIPDGDLYAIPNVIRPRRVACGDLF